MAQDKDVKEYIELTQSEFPTSAQAKKIKGLIKHANVLQYVRLIDKGNANSLIRRHGQLLKISELRNNIGVEQYLVELDALSTDAVVVEYSRFMQNTSQRGRQYELLNKIFGEDGVYPDIDSYMESEMTEREGPTVMQGNPIQMPYGLSRFFHLDYNGWGPIKFGLTTPRHWITLLTTITGVVSGVVTAIVISFTSIAILNVAVGVLVVAVGWIGGFLAGSYFIKFARNRGWNWVMKGVATHTLFHLDGLSNWFNVRTMYGYTNSGGETDRKRVQDILLAFKADTIRAHEKTMTLIKNAFASLKIGEGLKLFFGRLQPLLGTLKLLSELSFLQLLGEHPADDTTEDKHLGTRTTARKLRVYYYTDPGASVLENAGPKFFAWVAQRSRWIMVVSTGTVFAANFLLFAPLYGIFVAGMFGALFGPINPAFVGIGALAIGYIVGTIFGRMVGALATTVLFRTGRMKMPEDIANRIKQVGWSNVFIAILLDSGFTSTIFTYTSFMVTFLYMITLGISNLFGAIPGIVTGDPTGILSNLNQFAVYVNTWLPFDMWFIPVVTVGVAMLLAFYGYQVTHNIITLYTNKLGGTEKIRRGYEYLDDRAEEFENDTEVIKTNKGRLSQDSVKQFNEAYAILQDRINILCNGRKDSEIVTEADMLKAEKRLKKALKEKGLPPHITKFTVTLFKSSNGQVLELRENLMPKAKNLLLMAIDRKIELLREEKRVLVEGRYAPGVMTFLLGLVMTFSGAVFLSTTIPALVTMGIGIALMLVVAVFKVFGRSVDAAKLLSFISFGIIKLPSDVAYFYIYHMKLALLMPLYYTPIMPAAKMVWDQIKVRQDNRWPYTEKVLPVGLGHLVERAYYEESSKPVMDFSHKLGEVGDDFRVYLRADGWRHLKTYGTAVGTVIGVCFLLPMYDLAKYFSLSVTKAAPLMDSFQKLFFQNAFQGAATDAAVSGAADVFSWSAWLGTYGSLVIVGVLSLAIIIPLLRRIVMRTGAGVKGKFSISSDVSSTSSMSEVSVEIAEEEDFEPTKPDFEPTKPDFEPTEPGVASSENAKLVAQLLALSDENALATIVLKGGVPGTAGETAVEEALNDYFEILYTSEVFSPGDREFMQKWGHSGLLKGVERIGRLGVDTTAAITAIENEKKEGLEAWAKAQKAEQLGQESELSKEKVALLEELLASIDYLSQPALRYVIKRKQGEGYDRQDILDAMIDKNDAEGRSDTSDELQYSVDHADAVIEDRSLSKPDRLSEQDFVKIVIVGETTARDAHAGSLRRILYEKITMRDVDRASKSFIYNGIHCPEQKELEAEYSLISPVILRKIIGDVNSNLETRGFYNKALNLVKTLNLTKALNWVIKIGKLLPVVLAIGLVSYFLMKLLGITPPESVGTFMAMVPLLAIPGPKTEDQEKTLEEELKDITDTTQISEMIQKSFALEYDTITKYQKSLPVAMKNIQPVPSDFAKVCLEDMFASSHIIRNKTKLHDEIFGLWQLFLSAKEALDQGKKTYFVAFDNQELDNYTQMMYATPDRADAERTVLNKIASSRDGEPAANNIGTFSLIYEGVSLAMYQLQRSAQENVQMSEKQIEILSASLGSDGKARFHVESDGLLEKRRLSVEALSVSDGFISANDPFKCNSNGVPGGIWNGYMWNYTATEGGELHVDGMKSKYTLNDKNVVDEKIHLQSIYNPMIYKTEELVRNQPSMSGLLMLLTPDVGGLAASFKMAVGEPSAAFQMRPDYDKLRGFKLGVDDGASLHNMLDYLLISLDRGYGISESEVEAEQEKLYVCFDRARRHGRLEYTMVDTRGVETTGIKIATEALEAAKGIIASEKCTARFALWKWLSEKYPISGLWDKRTDKGEVAQQMINELSAELDMEDVIIEGMDDAVEEAAKQGRELVVVSKELIRDELLMRTMVEKYGVKFFVSCHGSTKEHVVFVATASGAMSLVGLPEAIFNKYVATGGAAAIFTSEAEMGAFFMAGEQGAEKAIKVMESITLKDYYNMAERVKREETNDSAAYTLDGEKLSIYGNVNLPYHLNVGDFGIAEEGAIGRVRRLYEHGASGIALARTEYMYTRETPPDFKLQYDIYLGVANEADYPVTLRTFDKRHDKECIALEEVGTAHSFEYYKTAPGEEALKVQLKAMLVAYARSNYKNIKVMVPMVSDTADMEFFGLVLDKAKKEVMDEFSDLNEEVLNDMPIGIMVETKEIVQGDNLDKVLDNPYVKVSFMSIGTNDLTSNVKGKSRERLEDKDFDKEMLAILEKVVKVAADRDITASICGDHARFDKTMFFSLYLFMKYSVFLTPGLIDSIVPKVKVGFQFTNAQNAFNVFERWENMTDQEINDEVVGKVYTREDRIKENPEFKQLMNERLKKALSPVIREEAFVERQDGKDEEALIWQKVEGQDNVYEVKLVIADELGLHARPSAALVGALGASDLEGCTLSAMIDGKMVEDINARSVLALMGLDAKLGTTLTLRMEGDEGQVKIFLDKLRDLENEINRNKKGEFAFQTEEEYFGKDAPTPAEITEVAPAKYPFLIGMSVPQWNALSDKDRADIESLVQVAVLEATPEEMSDKGIMIGKLNIARAERADVFGAGLVDGEIKEDLKNLIDKFVVRMFEELRDKVEMDEEMLAAMSKSLAANFEAIGTLDLANLSIYQMKIQDSYASFYEKTKNDVRRVKYFKDAIDSKEEYYLIHYADGEAVLSERKGATVPPGLEIQRRRNLMKVAQDTDKQHDKFMIMAPRGVVTPQEKEVFKDKLLEAWMLQGVVAGDDIIVLDRKAEGYATSELYGMVKDANISATHTNTGVRCLVGELHYDLESMLQIQLSPEATSNINQYEVFVNLLISGDAGMLSNIQGLITQDGSGRLFIYMPQIKAIDFEAEVRAYERYVQEVLIRA